MSVDWQSPGHRQQLKRTKGDGSSGIRVAGARQRAGVPPPEPGQGGGLGVAERTRALEALHCGGLPPH